MTGLPYRGLAPAERQLLRHYLDEPRIGSLFSGYGGLDMGVQAAIGGGRVAWHVEYDAAPSRILEHRFPGVPNYGDVTAVDWSTVEPVDILTGGFPCQDVSLAGLRRGLKDGTRSGLWSEFAVAIDQLRPRLVVIENVRGLLSAEADRGMESDPWGMGNGKRGPALRALGAVLGDLAELGYDTRWGGFRAADAGAPHGRFRVFILAYPYGSRLGEFGGLGSVERDPYGCDSANGDGHATAPAPLAQDPDVAARGERRIAASGQAEGGRPRADTGRRGRASAADAERLERVGQQGEQPGRATASGGGGNHHAAADADCDVAGRRAAGDVARSTSSCESDGDQRERDGDAARDSGAARRSWGPYAPAVERWERVTGRTAPAPTSPTDAYLKMLRRRLDRLDPRPVGMRGSLAPRQNLSPVFVEWMMGLPAGWLTAPDVGLTRAQQLKALGNGVVPQQAALAVATLLAAEAAA